VVCLRASIHCFVRVPRKCLQQAQGRAVAHFFIQGRLPMRKMWYAREHPPTVWFPCPRSACNEPQGRAAKQGMQRKEEGGTKTEQGMKRRGLLWRMSPGIRRVREVVEVSSAGFRARHTWEPPETSPLCQCLRLARAPCHGAHSPSLLQLLLAGASGRTRRCTQSVFLFGGSRLLQCCPLPVCPGPAREGGGQRKAKKRGECE